MSYGNENLNVESDIFEIQPADDRTGDTNDIQNQNDPESDEYSEKDCGKAEDHAPEYGDHDRNALFDGLHFGCPVIFREFKIQKDPENRNKCAEQGNADQKHDPSE